MMNVWVGYCSKPNHILANREQEDVMELKQVRGNLENLHYRLPPVC